MLACCSTSRCLFELMKGKFMGLDLSPNFLELASQDVLCSGNALLQLLDELISLTEKLVLFHQSLRL